MLSIPGSYSVAACLPRLPYLAETRLSSCFLPARFHGHRPAPAPITAVGANPAGADPLDGLAPLRTLFPGGFKRPEIKVPSLVLRVSAEEVLRRDDFGAALGAAISRGVGIVVLDVLEQSGGLAYEAACALKSLVGDRAYLLIAERVDVAAAIGASGVVLSDKGIPAIVARNMISKSKSDTVFLPLVVRALHNAISAEHAASSDGADFLIINIRSENYKGALDELFHQHVKVPIFFNIELSRESLAADVVSKLLQSGASGVVLSLEYLKLFSDDFLERIFSSKFGSMRLSKDGYPDSGRLEVNAVTNMPNVEKGIAGFSKLNDEEIKLLEAEGLLLQEAVAVVRKAAPMVIF